jgi:hypothetical protein
MSGGRQIRNISLFAGAVVAIAGLVVVAIFNPRAAAAGWLVGFTFWSQILLGSVLLLMIHRLTSGRWGEIIAPALIAAADSIPWLLILAIPIFVAIPSLYPWSKHVAAIKPDVLSHYLNMPFFVGRSVIALGGWTILAFALLRLTGARGLLVAAIGLAFHCIAISSIAVDWYLSLEAPFTSSSFGASIAVIQLIAAMAWAVLLAPEAAADENVGDLGALLLAFLLGITYIDFMAVLVIWYGDLPHEEIWFVERGFMPWPILAAAAFILVSVVPIFLLMLSRVRTSRRLLRAIGAGVLIGVACYDVYLIAPPFGSFAIIPAILSLFAIGLAFLGWMSSGVRALYQKRTPAPAS